jgi:hypothetical protein
VIKRSLSFAALVAASASFALAVYFLHRVIGAYCGRLRDAESAGDCFDKYALDVPIVSILFGISALVLAILILLPNSKSADK